MELILHTEGWYDASHHLEKYDGKCANSHGHTYLVRVWVKVDSSQLDESGILWSCVERLEAFDKANIQDPIEYEK